MVVLFKLAVRRLAKAPGFTIATVLMLALGVAMSTLSFTITNGVLLRPLPFRDPEQLVWVSTVSPRETNPMLAPGNAMDVRDRLNDVAEFGLFIREHQNVAEPGQPPVQQMGLSVSANVLPLLGIQPVLGRGFLSGDDQPNQPPVMLLTHRFWRERFGADPSVLGKVLRVQSTDRVVVGVLPAMFDETLLWPGCKYVTTMTVWPNWRAERSAKWMSVLGRLRPGVSLGFAQVRLEALARQIALEHPSELAADSFRAQPLGPSATTPHLRLIYWLVVALALLVLVIASANLGAVQLSRALGREAEFAIRAALGATRFDLVAMLATESLLVGATGTALGLLLTKWTAGVFSRWIVGAALPLDGRVIGFGLLAGLLATLCSGIGPAWLITGNTAQNLKRTSRGSTPRGADSRLKDALIIGQLGIALVLVIAAASMTFGVRAFTHRDRGWRPDALVTSAFQVPASWSEKERKEPRLTKLLETKLGAIPGVQRVAITSDVLLYGDVTHEPVTVEGGERDVAGQEPQTFVASVNAAFFPTLGITLREGRLLPAAPRRGDPPVVVVSATTARRLWPNRTALGKRVRVGQESVWREVIGVVADATFATDYASPPTTLQIYRPAQDAPNLWYGAVLQSPVSALALEKSIRAAFHEIDPDIMVVQIGNLPEMLEGFASMGPLNPILLTFAASGLVVAVIGLYGVMSQFAQQRRRDIGVRIALGAAPADVVRLILARAARKLVLGTCIGLVCSYAVVVVFHRALPELPLLSVAEYVLTASALVLVGLLACYLPCARATRVNPAEVLRTE